MKTIASDAKDRPFIHLSDYELASNLKELEYQLYFSELSNEKKESICLKRNNLIEEIIYRYEN